MKKHQNGDTLIEVMFATAIAALLIIIALSAMNRSLSQIQMAVETTFVRQSIDSEAEVIRFIRDAYMDNRSAASGSASLWKTIPTKGAASNFGECDMNNMDKEFIITGSESSDVNFSEGTGIKSLSLNTSVGSSITYAKLGEGIWV